ncbi:hypothetical protein OF001_U170039 [Pseudomonas sp. OF001]|uniref:hypothetical protein n=1 Tax=Pseudomonas sp. OF001 TaxID=2772300 RepID=UPI001917C6CC|nr:hypothetical protein [Pseudomonas sp. OF001]CAD5376742.1 hypothetical protein OF001_U170039 [Pseudomonas sp. OF001]
MKVTTKRSAAGHIDRLSFADFIRNAKSDEKKRVYRIALDEATKTQNDLLAEFHAKQRA